ncbi:hypothetical protein [Allomuricauda sp. SCSIO 65647]|uniref:hypothetical protein n=1 Tax=Allomuricauda sp. SCSIO 65647 TaxID=2908843 RepID=UPI001F164ACA|nr:hypothetical protein [Muricauda sp. SCSIO 65647]UJH66644.1 hypothetical protein L0P89_11800 [Muricauda sp. SCSIO 65647]
MISKFKYIPLIIWAMLIMSACHNGPKVIEPVVNTKDSPNSSTQLGMDENASPHGKLHSVIVQEVLHATRYVYLRVKEGQEEFWIATRKMDAKKGETYFYRGGLLKTDFESREHDRIFKKIYLVTNLVSEKDHSTLAKAEPKSNPVMEKGEVTKEDIQTHTEKTIEFKGHTTIAELLKDPKKYEGHSVEISGTCVKINPGIMGRNWLHLRDGSKDDYDLVVTSNALVTEGSKITVRAVVTLNKDFGAGYSYELILENGTLVE